MTPRGLGGLVASCVLATACGATPAAPTPTASVPFLVGTWDGSVTLSRAGVPDTVAPTTWTIVATPLSGDVGYTATVRVDDSWLPITTTLTTSLTPPAPGGRFFASGSYRSPRGCTGLVTSDGTAQPTRIDASFDGSDCLQLPQTAVFYGRVVLTKRR